MSILCRCMSRTCSCVKNAMDFLTGVFLLVAYLWPGHSDSFTPTLSYLFFKEHLQVKNWKQHLFAAMRGFAVITTAWQWPILTFLSPHTFEVWSVALEERNKLLCTHKLWVKLFGPKTLSNFHFLGIKSWLWSFSLHPEIATCPLGGLF